jgi:hypothetical protein
MMFMAMKLDKSQVNAGSDTYAFKAAGSYSFKDRDLAIMAGYTKYEAFLVGAASGFGGNAIGKSGTNGDGITLYGGGASGGGSLRLMDTLLAMAASEPIVVGDAGTDGADKNDNTTAGIGTAGGNTTFRGYSAYGGTPTPNGGARINGNANGYAAGGGGGNGGGNSANLGTGGLGSDPNGASWSTSGTPSGYAGTNAGTGYFQAGGTPPVVGGGFGGGGGRGNLTGIFTGVSYTSSPGATGNNTAYACTGASSVSNKGGAGGGADLFPITGVHEYYGTRQTGRFSSGAFVLKLS